MSDQWEEANWNLITAGADGLMDYRRKHESDCFPMREDQVAEIVLKRAFSPHPLSDWHEDIGPVLWWAFPVTEPPYVGTPLDQNRRVGLTYNGVEQAGHTFGGWPGYHTHWTPIPIPEAPG